MSFASGESVGAYRIVEKLGQGGMATVFKAYHPALDRYVAIKVLHPAFTEDPDFLARFQREARIVAKLDHPHIVPIYDFAEHRDHPYLVMRFIEGETLKARLQRGPPELPEILRIARAVGQALIYAHERGVLHRDIKPSNILLTPDGGVYLTDFGLARMAEAGASTLSRDILIGTPQYISPEQAKGLTKLDARTDIYSLGIVLYELLVGQVPFTADTPYAIIHDHIFTPLPFPRKLNPDLPEPLERVLVKALAKEPDDRYQSVAEMMTALEQAAGEGMPETVTVPVPLPATELVARPIPTPAPVKNRRWSWVLIGIALGLMLCVGLFLGVAGWQKGRETRAQEFLAQAGRAAQGGNVQEAVALYRRAWSLDPDLVEAYLGAGDLLVLDRRIEGAIQIYNAGVEANPDDVALHARLAGVYVLTRNLAGAQEQVDWLLEHAPEVAISHALMGIVVVFKQDCEAARPHLEEALRQNPGLPEAHFAQGLCYERAGDQRRADEEFKLVINAPGVNPLLKAQAVSRLSPPILGATPEAPD